MTTSYLSRVPEEELTEELLCEVTKARYRAGPDGPASWWNV
jgi:hypothetical protein